LNESDKPLSEIGDAVHSFTELDELCERIKEKGICDALGVQCNSSCSIYAQKEERLRILEGFIKVQPSVAVGQVAPKPIPDQPKTVEKSERCCPSCGQKPAREEAKYCDYCGEEF